MNWKIWISLFISFFLDYTGQAFTGYNIDLNTGNSLDYNPGSNAGYNPDYSPGYSSSSNGGFCGFLGKFLMCQCTEEAICEENLIPYGYCPMHPMMPMVRTQCCPKSYVMMCSQQNNPYETQGGSYFLMMQSAANRELWNLIVIIQSKILINIHLFFSRFKVCSIINSW